MLFKKRHDETADELKRTVKRLEERVAQLEADCEPFRIGEDLPLRFGDYWRNDHRPRVCRRPHHHGRSPAS